VLFAYALSSSRADIYLFKNKYLRTLEIKFSQN
jgi:hypothetical protein